MHKTLANIERNDLRLRFPKPGVASSILAGGIVFLSNFNVFPLFNTIQATKKAIKYPVFGVSGSTPVAFNTLN